jgi:hypothetical protein
MVVDAVDSEHSNLSWQYGHFRVLWFTFQLSKKHQGHQLCSACKKRNSTKLAEVCMYLYDRREVEDIPPFIINSVYPDSR